MKVDSLMSSLLQESTANRVEQCLLLLIASQTARNPSRLCCKSFGSSTIVLNNTVCLYPPLSPCLKLPTRSHGFTVVVVGRPYYNLRSANEMQLEGLPVVEKNGH